MGSFKWAVIGKVGLVLLIICALTTLAAHVGLSHLFFVKHEQLHDTYRQRLQALLRQKQQDLSSIAHLITRQMSEPEAYRYSSESQRAEQVIDALWWFLNHNHDISEILLIDRTGTPTHVWGNDLAHKRNIKPPKDVLSLVASTLQAAPYFRCQPTCVQQLVFPLHIRGVLTGVLVISAAVEKTLLQPNLLANTELFIVTPQTPLDLESDLSRPREPLAVHTAGQMPPELTPHSGQNLPLLGRQEGPKRLKHRDKRYQLSLQDLSFNELVLPFKVAILTPTKVDDTLAASIRQAFISALLLSALMALLSFSLLLKQPLAKLKQVAHALDLLGHKRFAELRNSIGAPKHSESQDEVSLVQHKVYQLAHTLQSFDDQAEAQVHSLNSALASRDREAIRAKNLLDKAPVLIVTHDKDNGIRDINHSGLRFIQQAPGHLTGKPFHEVFQPHDESRDAFALYHQLDLTHSGQTTHESQLTLPDNSRKRIAWAHCPMPDSECQSACILSVGVDITEQRLAQEHIAFMAKYDDLTGLLNRAYFRQTLAQLLEQCIPGVLCYIDLNHFKLVNDTYGHQAGDAVLAKVAKALRRCFPDDSTMGRLGGDEFVVVIAHGDVNTSIECLKELNIALEEVSLAHNRISLSVSAGIVPFTGWNERIDTLMHRADCAMYETKEPPGQNWHVYNGQERILTRLQESVSWDRSIKQTLEAQKFEIHYQPIYCLKNMKITGHEALLRLRGPDEALEAPATFIHFAEKNGWSVQVDQCIFSAVLQQAEKRISASRDQNIHINLSAKSFTSDEMMDFITQKLKESHFPSNRLVIEVTETGSMQDIDQGRKCAALLQRLGCQIAVDDFGTGFGSLVYLAEFPVDKVKIDVSFIREITQNPDHQKLVSAIKELSHSLNKTTVAEGIEDLATLNLLRDMGIDQAQGFFLGKPTLEPKQEDAPKSPKFISGTIF